MIAVEDLTVYVPKNKIPLSGVLNAGAISKYTYLRLRKEGYRDILCDENKTGLEMIFKLLDQIYEKDREVFKKVKYLVLSFGPGILPNNLNLTKIIEERYDTRIPIIFSVLDLYCATFIKGVDVATNLLRFEGEKGTKAIVISSIKNIIPEQRYDGSYVAGDACTLLVLNNEDKGDRIETIKTSMDTKTIKLKEDGTPHWDSSYFFNITETISEALIETNLSKDEIAMIFPNNVSDEVWKSVAILLRIPFEDFSMESHQLYGRLPGLDYFINLSLAKKKNLIHNDRYYMVVSIGGGGIVGCMILKKRHS
ncbi:3-oxoacyl-[acyl-carrier-protein] synthase III C-terminal domain-containing protein [Cytobacillus pseudoceanisediminis]|uniref:3-oxoacyl-[acyl-carrier-protein] synthase III C-terminal domain-containing protein n=1 Tax=Cytobacillus pseudoceanisediminis TaxID=3051614 RepID=UPI003C2D7A2E